MDPMGFIMPKGNYETVKTTPKTIAEITMLPQFL
jgi:hypothetical protein